MKEAAIKRKEQQAAQKSKLLLVKEDLKASRAALSAEKKRFRNWRSKHPEADLSKQFAAAQKGGKLNDTKLEELLDNYKSRYSMKESTMGSSFQHSEQSITAAISTRTILSYPDVCVKYGLDMLSEASTTMIDKFCMMGLIKKQKTGKKELEAATAAQLGGEATASQSKPM